MTMHNCNSEPSRSIAYTTLKIAAVKVKAELNISNNSWGTDETSFQDFLEKGVHDESSQSK